MLPEIIHIVLGLLETSGSLSRKPSEHSQTRSVKLTGRNIDDNPIGVSIDYPMIASINTFSRSTNDS